MIKTGGGRYDPAESFIYFLAGVNLGEGDGTLGRHGKASSFPYRLMALNDLDTKQGVAEFEANINNNGRMMLDSGIFSLTMHHARAHGVHMNDALALHPNEIDGFKDLRDAYVELVRKYEADLWGYVELDQGGADRKRETRAWLESEGLRPIPVYHPLNDGWDYFDELAEGYDRICFANLVVASPRDRKRLLVTAWERHRRYPHLWIHYLGVTPNEVITAYPGNSSDSSGWVYALRYGAHSAPGAHAMGDVFSRFTDGFSYTIGSDPTGEDGSIKAVKMLAGEAVYMQACWRRQYADQATVFDQASPYPDPYPGEAIVRGSA